MKNDEKNKNHIEIERKFLTTNIPFDLNNYECAEISQIYVSTSPTIRIRQFNNIYILTVKSSGELSRQEFEIQITKSQFKHLSTKADTLPLTKTRYFIPLDDKKVAEVDIYHGDLEGLMTTEVEFITLEDATTFIPPDWMGEDVSKDNRYKNSNLSRYGIPKND